MWGSGKGCPPMGVDGGTGRRKTGNMMTMLGVGDRGWELLDFPLMAPWSTI